MRCNDSGFSWRVSFRFDKIASSVFASTADKASSKINNSGSTIKARAIEIRCFVLQKAKRHVPQPLCHSLQGML